MGRGLLLGPAGPRARGAADAGDGLLRHPGRVALRHQAGDQEGLPQARCVVGSRWSLPNTPIDSHVNHYHHRGTTTALRWHPDVCKEPNAADKFKEINKAYEALSDDEKRAR